MNIKRAALLPGYAALAGAAFLLAQFVIAPLYVFTGGFRGRGGVEVCDRPLRSLNRMNSPPLSGQRILRDGDRTGACVGASSRCSAYDEWHSVLLPEGQMPNMNKER
ncbi:MAG: hypothetical protein ACLUI3_15710 [Christensenellales bacterium]